MTGPDPHDVQRFDQWSRELFGGGCTHGLQTLPPRMAQARFHRSTDREIRRRVWWWRLKRALKSREVWITALVLALMMAFLAGKGFAEPQLRCIPSADGLLPPGCEDSGFDYERAYVTIAFGGALLLAIGCVAVLLSFRLAREAERLSEGEVLPREPWR